MRRIMIAAAALATLAASNYVYGQVVDPDVRGPARRAAGAAGEALGAPGVENRIERRQERRGAPLAGADRWRMRYYNGEWWYYTPQNSWVYYRDNRWSPYDRGTFRAIAPRRYATGYRGTYTGRADRFDPMAAGRPGAPDLTIGIQDGSFEPQSINVAAGSTIRWMNHGGDDHSVTADNNSFDSGDLSPGGSYSARFRQPGTYTYHCELHPEMKGTIVVAEAAAAPGVDVNVDRQGGVNVDANRPGGPQVDVDRSGVEVQTPRTAPEAPPAVPRPQSQIPAPSNPQ
jgi:plastocyanin